jgi:cytochrome c oxidase subunit 1
MTIVEPEKTNLPATVDPDGPGSGDLVPAGNGTGPSRPLGVFTRPSSTTGWRSWITTVDHKRIGIMYSCTAMVFFIVGGVEALLLRTQLAAPEPDAVVGRPVQPGVHHARRDDDLPVHHADGLGFMNYLIPLQIGARDVAFPASTR